MNICQNVKDHSVPHSQHMFMFFKLNGIIDIQHDV